MGSFGAGTCFEGPVAGIKNAAPISQPGSRLFSVHPSPTFTLTLGYLFSYLRLALKGIFGIVADWFFAVARLSYARSRFFTGFNDCAGRRRSGRMALPERRAVVSRRVSPRRDRDRPFYAAFFTGLRYRAHPHALAARVGVFNVLRGDGVKYSQAAFDGPGDGAGDGVGRVPGFFTHARPGNGNGLDAFAGIVSCGHTDGFVVRDHK